MNEYILFVILGLFVGLLSTFFGAGGGVFIVPILPLMYEISIREVVPTSLFTVLLVVVINTLFFRKNKLVNWQAGIITGLTASLCAFIISRASIGLDVEVIQGAISVILILCALMLVFIKHDEDYFRDRDDSQVIRVSVLTGLLAGFGHGLTGIGAGLLIVPLYLVFNVVPYSQIVPTANLCMIFSSSFALLGYWSKNFSTTWPHLGAVRLDIALAIVFGTFFTAHLGRKYQHIMPSFVRRYILAIIMLSLALYGIFKS